MKASLWILFFAGLSLAGLHTAQAASTNTAILRLELQDGSNVIGKGDTANFKFHSDVLGDIKLTTEQLRQIEFFPKTPNSVKLVTAKGDTLTAKMVTKEILMKTSFGKIAVPARIVRRLSVIHQLMPGRIREGLVALWPGEGNGNDSIGNNPATAVGALNYTAGKRGRGFFFDGDSGYLIIQANEALDVGKADGFTFAAWVCPATVAQDMLIFEFERELGTSNGSDVGMELAIHQATIEGRGTGCLYANVKDVQDASHVFTSPPNLLRLGIWQHVALTYDKATGIGTIYQDGKAVALSNLGTFSPQTSFPNLLLGAKTTYNTVLNPGNLYDGRLDEFAVYSRALSAEEIQAIYLEENGDATSN